MNPRRLYVEQLLPALKNFLTGYSSRELSMGEDIARGAEVANTLLSFPDYIFRDSPIPAPANSFRSEREYREQRCWSSQPHYEFTCDFANAWKHRKITRDRKSIDGIASVQEVYAICRFLDDSGFYYRTIKLVMVRRPDGREMDLRRMLVASSQFWARELSELGYVPPTPSHLFEFTERIERSDQTASLPLHLYCTQNERVSIDGRCLDFDYTLNRLVDAKSGTGFDGTATLKFTVRPSPFDANMSV